ncbi:MAG: right-handed parallel beta-helix repeat-containing protein [Tannerellaceae bacterium]
MKKTISILFFISFLCSCSNDVTKDVTKDVTNLSALIPDSRGRLDMESAETSQIRPGSIIYLKGKFLSVRFVGLKGSAQQPIRITNYPGQTLTVGDPNWSGGAYSNAIQLLECQHIILGGENSKSDFIIEGSTHPQKQASYFGIALRPFTDNIEIKNITIRNGGIAISAKTDPEKDNPKTWYPNTVLENLSIHDVEISGAAGEAMYLGHTSPWWGWDENGHGYNAGVKPDNPAHTYVIPIRYKNVKIYNNYVHHLGYDGIQASAMDQLEIYNNEVADFGLKKVWGQCMGIIVGSRTTNTNTHDNYVHDGFGELIQFHGANEGNATHVISNNLLVHTQGSGIGIYGTTDAATIKISNNTIVDCQTYAIQTNGRSFATKSDLRNNVFVSYYQKAPSRQKYIWIINGSSVEETDNKLFDTPMDALIDPNNFYQPLPGSTIGNAGYKK